MEKDYKKLYEDALETAKAYYKQNKGVVDGVECLSIIFPELGETGDEKIRKWLKEMVELVRKANPDNADHTEMCSEALAWLKKQGEQNNLAWSEADEKQARQIKRIVHDAGCAQKLQEQITDWLKSLKERYTWKPTDEQMEAVKCAALDVSKFSSTSEQLMLENEPYYKALDSLYQDLKKLKE